MLIVVAEDEPTVREALEIALELDGYEVEVAPDGVQALALLERLAADALVLDVTMPLLDGLEVCRRLRDAGNEIPILIVTAREAVSERVEGLDAGADDYLVKPFAVDEFLARVRALVRRHGGGSRDLLRYDDIELDPRRHTVKRGDRQLVLTRTEFALLELFLTNPEQVLSRDLITDRIWGLDAGPDSNVLEVYISYLRRKLEEGRGKRLIETVRGVGYILRR